MTVERILICMVLSICLCVKSYVSLDNLPEILCLISYLKVSSFMWLFRSHYLAKVGQNWLNWQNCLNGDINKAPPSPRTQFAWQYVGWGKKHLVAIWAWSMVKFLWWYDGDVFFSQRCDTDVFWTLVNIATDAIIWTFTIVDDVF